MSNNIRIAAGKNNTAGYTDFEAITDANGNQMGEIKTLGTWENGEEILTLGGTVRDEGFPYFEFRISPMLYALDEKLSTDYCSGGRSGHVTVRTRRFRDDDYVNCNALMILPKMGGVHWENDYFWALDYKIRFYYVEVI